MPAILEMLVGKTWEDEGCSSGMHAPHPNMHAPDLHDAAQSLAEHRL